MRHVARPHTACIPNVRDGTARIPSPSSPGHPPQRLQPSPTTVAPTAGAVPSRPPSRRPRLSRRRRRRRSSGRGHTTRPPRPGAARSPPTRPAGGRGRQRWGRSPRAAIRSRGHRSVVVLPTPSSDTAPPPRWEVLWKKAKLQGTLPGGEVQSASTFVSSSSQAVDPCPWAATMELGLAQLAQPAQPSSVYWAEPKEFWPILKNFKMGFETHPKLKPSFSGPQNA